jgi:hypothetical protein
MGRQQFGTFHHLLILVVPEPVLARFKACADRMTSRSGMFGTMLTGGAIAAPDVTALRTAAKVQPPAIACKALYAPKAAGFGIKINPSPCRSHVYVSLTAHPPFGARSEQCLVELFNVATSTIDDRVKTRSQQRKYC